nr:flavodoxin-dependent (E)-4-hydroxy-3-methylbut-2-enyl-diphosphate synthase [Blastococcus sp. PRF04-17]
MLAPRRRTRQLDVGGVGVGSDFPVSVQSMTTTKTADINATLQQIAELTAAGCQIVRVAVPDTDDAEALPPSRGSRRSRSSPTSTSSRATCSPRSTPDAPPCA